MRMSKQSVFSHIRVFTYNEQQLARLHACSAQVHCTLLLLSPATIVWVQTVHCGCCRRCRTAIYKQAPREHYVKETLKQRAETVPKPRIAVCLTFI